MGKWDVFLSAAENSLRILSCDCALTHGALRADARRLLGVNVSARRRFQTAVKLV